MSLCQLDTRFPGYYQRGDGKLPLAVRIFQVKTSQRWGGGHSFLASTGNTPAKNPRSLLPFNGIFERASSLILVVFLWFGVRGGGGRLSQRSLLVPPPPRVVGCSTARRCTVARRISCTWTNTTSAWRRRPAATKAPAASSVPTAAPCPLPSNGCFSSHKPYTHKCV